MTVSPTLSAKAEDRHFYDPPELIQMAFGGRPWFFEADCRTIHRVGLFKGLGWILPPRVARQDKRGIQSVRITARRRHSDLPQLYDMEFLGGQLADEPRVVHHVPGLQAHQLKGAYAHVLGEHAV